MEIVETQDLHLYKGQFFSPQFFAQSKFYLSLFQSFKTHDYVRKATKYQHIK